MSLQGDAGFNAGLAKRHRLSTGFAWLCSICTWSAIAILLVLLMSVAANVNRNGTLAVFVYGKDIPDTQFDEIQKIVNEQDHVTSVEREVSPSGDVSFHLTVEDLRTDAIRATRSSTVIENLKDELGALKISDGVDIAFEDNDKGQVFATITGEPNETEVRQISGTLNANVNVWNMAEESTDGGRKYTLDTNVRYKDIEASIAEKLEAFKATARQTNPDLNIETDSTEPVVGWDWGFLWRSNSTQKPENAGVRTGIWGSIWLVLVTALIAVPLGVGAAVYLEEYSSDTWVTRIIKLNLANLAGVPSIVYGILGFAVFGRFLALGSTVLAGALTLALLILPIIIVATQEALKAIPASIRTASIALGATKWQTVRHQVLPASLPWHRDWCDPCFVTSARGDGADRRNRRTGTDRYKPRKHRKPG